MKSIEYTGKLRDDQWEKVAHILSRASGLNLAKHDNRVIIEAVLWVILNKKSWADIPSHFGSGKRIYSRFHRWNESAIWHLLARRSIDDQELHQMLTQINDRCDFLNRRRESRARDRMPIQQRVVVLPIDCQSGVTVHEQSAPDQSR